MSDSLSLYLHIPFCRHRCAYCDFNTYANQEDSLPAYVDALVNEIHFVGQQGRLPVHTIFFGGGTPSLLSASQFEKILTAISDAFDLTDPETTIEANPGTVSLDYLRDLHSLGVNRISFGVQSAHPDELRMLERAHDFFDVIDAVAWARQAGFDNLSLDLIYGLPEQSLDRWQATVKQAVDLAPEHLSLYSLTMEHGTPFGRWSSRGLMPYPDPDSAAEMYEWADEFLAGNGFEQYEISNWSKVKGQKSKVGEPQPSTFDLQPAFACRHNLQYWRNLDYLGLGAGAHGYAEGVRYSNVLRIKTYIERLKENREWGMGNRVPGQLPAYEFPLTPATVNFHHNTPREAMQETLMTGLRLTREGVSDADFRGRFGLSIAEAFPKEVDELLKLGLLEWVEEEQTAKTLRSLRKPLKLGALSGSNAFHLRLTPYARLVANQVFLRFVGD